MHTRAFVKSPNSFHFVIRELWETFKQFPPKDFPGFFHFSDEIRSVSAVALSFFHKTFFSLSIFLFLAYIFLSIHIFLSLFFFLERRYITWVAAHSLILNLRKFNAFEESITINNNNNNNDTNLWLWKMINWILIKNQWTALIREFCIRGREFWPRRADVEKC